MGTGYASVEKELFFRDNTIMLFVDAQKMAENIVKRWIIKKGGFKPPIIFE